MESSDARSILTIKQLVLRRADSDVTLRLPTEEELAELAFRAGHEGLHDPKEMPFSTTWSVLPPAEMTKSIMLWHYRTLANFSTADWNVPFVVFLGNQPCGMQHLGAKNFADSGTVTSGSWLLRSFRRRGIGLRMRAAILDFAFDTLAADYATTGAYPHNTPSVSISRKLGYTDNGLEIVVIKRPNGEPDPRYPRQVAQNFILSGGNWGFNKAAGKTTVDGFQACSDWFTG